MTFAVDDRMKNVNDRHDLYVAAVRSEGYENIQSEKVAVAADTHASVIFLHDALDA